MREIGPYYPDLGIGVHEHGYRELKVEFVADGHEKKVPGGWIVGHVEPAGVVFMSEQGGFLYTREEGDTHE